MQAKRDRLKEQLQTKQQDELRAEFMVKLETNKIFDLTGPCCNLSFKRGQKAAEAVSLSQIQNLQLQLSLKDSEIVRLKDKILCNGTICSDDPQNPQIDQKCPYSKKVLDLRKD